MKIGIIGSGSVATTLAKGFLAHGHSVMLGTRDAAKLADFAAANPGASIDSVADAARFAELAVLAVKGSAALAALGSAATHLAGKTVIDTTNPIADEAPENGVIRYFTGGNDSLGERLQAAFPDIRIVKAFNSVGAPLMVNPALTERPSMFIAGNDTDAKRQVSAILEAFGWEPLDMGSILSSRAIEPLCQLWCIPGFLNNQWRHAFRLVRPN